MDSSDLKAFLATHSIDGRIHRFQRAVRTVAEAEAAVSNAHGTIAKSVIFEIAEQPVLVIVSVTKRVSPDSLSKVLGVARSAIRLMKPVDVEALTGYAIGSVPPLGHRLSIKTLIDQDLLNCHLLYLGGGDEFSLLDIDPRVLATAAKAVPAVFD